MKSHALAIVVLFVSGCVTQTDDKGNGAAAMTVYAPAETAEELVENFKRAFAEGNQAALDKMVLLEGGQELRYPSLLVFLSTGMAGDATITEANLRPAEARDRLPHYKLQPTHVLDYRAEYNDRSSTKKNSVLIAQHDGHTLFYISIPDER